jgi:hypothetical protein
MFRTCAGLLAGLGRITVGVTVAAACGAFLVGAVALGATYDLLASARDFK